MGACFGGTAGQYFCTGASRSSLPCCQSSKAAVAVIGFEMDASRYSVWEVAGTEFSRSAEPKPAVHSTAPFSTTATETPGILLAAMKREMAVSNCLRFSGAICPDCPTAAAVKRKGKITATKIGDIP